MDHTWLLVVVALLGATVGVAVGLAISASASVDPQATGSDDSLLGGGDGVLPVLAALPSTIVVLDDDDEVLRASAAAYTLNIVRDDTLREPQVAAMVARVRATGRIQDDTIVVARGRVSGAGHFHLSVRVAAIGRGRVLILIEDRTAAQRLEDMSPTTRGCAWTCSAGHRGSSRRAGAAVTATTRRTSGCCSTSSATCPTFTARPTSPARPSSWCPRPVLVRTRR